MEPIVEPKGFTQESFYQQDTSIREDIEEETCQLYKQPPPLSPLFEDEESFKFHHLGSEVDKEKNRGKFAIND